MASDPELIIYIDPGEASVEEITDLLVALCELNIASGGPGLVFSIKDEVTHAD